jgi:hypothetical protein
VPPIFVPAILGAGPTAFAFCPDAAFAAGRTEPTTSAVDPNAIARSIAVRFFFITTSFHSQISSA